MAGIDAPFPKKAWMSGKDEKSTMSFEKVKDFFEERAMGDRVMKLEHESATVEQAAEALGCEPKQIAKTMSFLIKGKEGAEPAAKGDAAPVGGETAGPGEGAILIVTAGDARIDNKKYKSAFGQKARMIPWDEVETHIGHAPGGVCPFVTKPGVVTYLDVSLQRFDVVYPAAGDGHSAVRLTPEELEETSACVDWIDVCSGWEDQA